MTLKQYFHTLVLNLLFILFLPIILSLFAKDSTIVLLIYLFAYSTLEHYADAIRFSPKSVYKFPVKGILITATFNFLLLFGVSAIINYVLFTLGFVSVYVLSIVFLAVLSALEIIIENKLIFKGV